MTLLVADIFRAVQKAGTSFSFARMACAVGNATLNGNQVDFFDDVEVNEGDLFELNLTMPFGRVGEDRRWTFQGDQWVKKV